MTITPPTPRNNMQALWNRAHYSAAELSGEYVLHIPSDGPPRWVTSMTPSIPPEMETGGVDFGLSNAKFMIFVPGRFFTILPQPYEFANAVNPESGSKFEVRGITREVLAVHQDSTELVFIELARNPQCQEANPDFEDNKPVPEC